MSKKLADRPPNVDKFIEKYGSEKITKLWLVREPVKSFVTTPLNIFTGGKVTSIKLEENYDKMYHLYIVFQLSDGTKQHLHKMEKNDVVQVHQNEFRLPDLDKPNVVHTYVSQLNKYIEEHDGSENGLKTFEQVINECEKAEPCLYYYSAKNYNCQNFVDVFLQHILPNGIHFDQETKEKYEKFILQNGFKKLFEQKGLKPFLKFLTDLKASLSRSKIPIIGNSAGHIVYNNEYADNYKGYIVDDQDYYYRSHDQFASYIMDENSYKNSYSNVQPVLDQNKTGTGSTYNLFILIIMFIFALFLICICGCFIGIFIGYFLKKIINKISIKNYSHLN